MQNLFLDFLSTEIQAAKMNKSLKRDILTNGTDHNANKKVCLLNLISKIIFEHNLAIRK